MPAFPFLPTSWATVAVTDLAAGNGGSAYLFNLAAPVYRLFAAPMGLSALTRGDALFGILGAGLISIAMAVVTVKVALKRVGRWF